MFFTNRFSAHPNEKALIFKECSAAPQEAYPEDQNSGNDAERG